MQSKMYDTDNLPCDITKDGNPVNIVNELRIRISFFQHSDNFVAQKAEGIFLKNERPDTNTDAIQEKFSEILKSSGTQWSILEFTGLKDEMELPEITRFFKKESISRASFYSGIVKGRFLRFAFTLILVTVLSTAVLVSFAFIPVLKNVVKLISDYPWILGAGTGVYLIYSSWKLVTILNSNETSTIQAFRDAIIKKDQDVISKLHRYFTNLVLVQIKRPIAIFVKDFSTLDKFTKDVIVNILIPEKHEPYSGGLFTFIIGTAKCELFEYLYKDPDFSKKELNGTYTIYELS